MLSLGFWESILADWLPVLVHDGSVHIESNDIIQYLEKMFPDPRLIPAGYDKRSPRSLSTKTISISISVLLAFASCSIRPGRRNRLSS